MDNRQGGGEMSTRIERLQEAVDSDDRVGSCLWVVIWLAGAITLAGHVSFRKEPVK
jgi:hypothetical protein